LPFTDTSFQFGSTVSARSVQLLTNPQGNEIDRDLDYWWDDIREEICKSAAAIGCTHVMGYRESVSIFHEIMVMTAFGTAIKLKGKI
jgi:hypothetical protein